MKLYLVPPYQPNPTDALEPYQPWLDHVLEHADRLRPLEHEAVLAAVQDLWTEWCARGGGTA